jgi:hypothetical protein
MQVEIKYSTRVISIVCIFVVCTSVGGYLFYVNLGDVGFEGSFQKLPVSDQEFNGQFHEGFGSGKGLNEETYISIHAIYALHLDYIKGLRSDF